MRNATCRTNHRWSFCDDRRVWTAVAIVVTAALLVFTPKVYGQSAAGTDPPVLPSPDLVVTAMPMTASEVPLSDWDQLGDHRSETAEGLDPWEHEERADALWSAAHLHLHSGEEQEAFEEFQAAAEAALDAGEVFRAARANLRAAYLATELNRMDEARRLLDRVRELADSPELTASQREHLAVEVDRPPRIGEPPLDRS